MLQTILIPKKFGYQKALQWMYEHNFPIKKVDIAKNFYRFRQSVPKNNSNYYTKRLDNGVELVFQY